MSVHMRLPLKMIPVWKTHVGSSTLNYLMCYKITWHFVFQILIRTGSPCIILPEPITLSLNFTNFISLFLYEGSEIGRDIHLQSMRKWSLLWLSKTTRFLWAFIGKQITPDGWHHQLGHSPYKIISQLINQFSLWVKKLQYFSWMYFI